MDLIEKKMGGRTNYNIYVPENVNEDTPVVFYAFNVKVTNKMKEDLIAQNEGAIVIIPQNSPVHVGSEYNGHEYQTEAIEVFDFLKEEYNLNTTQYTQAGFSASYGCSIRTMAKYIESNPDAGRQLLISTDGCESQTKTGFPIYDWEYEALKENDTIIISYSQKYRQKSEIKFLKEAGLPILFVVDPEIPENSYSRWSYYHDVIPSNFIERGLYNSFVDFAMGKGELPEGYIYQVYNPETGLIEDIAREDVAAFFKINTYETLVNGLKSLNLFDTSVTSDSLVLINHVNNILGCIKNSSFVQSGNSYSSSFASTTKVPSSIPSLVQDFYSSTANLLTKLANDVQQFVRIGEIFDEEDKKMQQEADELNNLPIGDNLSGVGNYSVDNNGFSSENYTSDDKITENNDYENQEGETKNQEDEKTERPNQKEDNQNSKPYLTEDGTVVQKTNNNGQFNRPNNYTNNRVNSNNVSSQQADNILNNVDDFPDFNEVYSDEFKIVYEYDDNCRIIIHKNGDEIVGIEHYYKFVNENLANDGFQMLSEKYISNNNIENIVQNDNYVKVIFKDDSYSNLSLNDIKMKFNELDEVNNIE